MYAGCCKQEVVMNIYTQFLEPSLIRLVLGSVAMKQYNTLSIYEPVHNAHFITVNLYLFIANTIYI